MSTELDIIPIEEWFKTCCLKPLMIAGPCSAESEEQVFTTAEELAKNKQVHVFRAGVWKPRTRPNTFEGIGEQALVWLQEIKKSTKMLTSIEVATAEHVELCLKYDVDMVWVGARTTANPFSVQAIADALKGSDIPVLVKNPVNPDLGQWIGSLERLNKVGIRKLGAIHRGFFPFEETAFRNIPKWEIPIELKSKFHDLPIICDPSHISGHTRLIAEVAQKALDINMDGLMIETHYKPDKALSDAAQQVTPAQLRDLLEQLQFRKANVNDESFAAKVENIRHQIDSIDNQLLELMAQRMGLVERIGAHKQEQNVAAFQLERWEKIRESRIQLAKRLGLDTNFVKRLMQMVHKESIQHQTNFMKKNTKK